MRHTIKIVAVIGAILSLLLVTACGSATPTVAPTADLNPFRTEVAATVLAQVAQTKAAEPTTPAPSPTATATLSATPTAVVRPTIDVQATLPGGTPGAGYKDQAEWVSQTVSDGTIFKPGEIFTITWTLKNVGTSTWTASYVVRYYSGETFGAPKEFLLGKEVLPGQTIDISIGMKAPVTPGNYRSDWVLSNENRSNFKEPFFLKITVAATPTPSATPRPTATKSP